MEEILRDPSPANLINAIEGNLSAWIPIFGMLGQSYLDNPPGVKRSITGLPFSLFNSIMDARLAPEQTEGTIHTIVTEATSRNIPVLWWIGPSTRPVDLGKHLEDNGFVLDERSPGLAMDLEKLDESLPELEGFSIQLVHDDSSFRQWSIVMGQGFGSDSPNELSVKSWSKIFRQTGSDVMEAYIGCLDEKLVAVSLLFMAAGVAGIYAVATIPEARRKGIGAMLTRYSLLRARSKGYRFGILQSSEMGLGVYRSLGFVEYCDIDTYLWSAKPRVAG